MTDRPLGFGRTSGATGSAGGTVAASGSSSGSVLDDDAAAALLPERPERGHKGLFGKVLVVAGSLDYAGAALLVCQAAARAGAGLLTPAVPESLPPLVAAKVVPTPPLGPPQDHVAQ